MDEFGERLRELIRRNKGEDYSERQMSLDLGRGQNYINNLANSKSMPSFDALEEICEFLGISLKDFFDVEFKGKKSAEHLYRRLDDLLSNQDDIDLLVSLFDRLDEDAFHGLMVFLRQVSSMYINEE